LSKLAAHYIPIHDRQADKDYIRSRSPYCLKIVYGSRPNVGHVNQMLSLLDLPKATVILRDHAMSEQHDDVMRNPVETGRRHAADWDAVLRQLKAETPLAQAAHVLVCGENEPHVWEAIAPPVDYNAAMMDAIKEAHVCALNLSVGWPANSGGDSPSNWRPYDPVLQRVSADGHWICLHEYFAYQFGPSFYAGWWAYRYRHLLAYRPNTPILIGECAPTKGVQHPDGSWGLDAHNGWMHDLSPQQAYNQLLEYDQGLQQDNAITYATVFTLDGGQPWIGEYDVNGLIGVWSEQQRPWLPSVTPPKPQPEPPKPQPEPEPEPEPGALVHPLPKSVITQHWGQNAEQYAQFGQWGHNGCDLGGVAEGTPICALADGRVAYHGTDDAYGNYIRCEMAGYSAYAFFAHLDEIKVRQGQALKAGKIIGTVGNTGNSTGAHLHLEIRQHNPDGSYSRLTPMARGRVDPESWCSLHGLKL
jgi:murein DD-endopeptidase MepM/ murein hydrolase activator NlpD